MCTYVLNRAGDGLDYWVFATVTAVEDGYVSVRTKPLDQDAFAAIRKTRLAARRRRHCFYYWRRRRP